MQPPFQAVVASAAMKKTLRHSLTAIVFLTSLIAAGCSGSGSAGGDSAKTAKAQVHTIRGQVVRLPDPASGDRSLTLAHEAIDNFAGRDGKVTGMDPMTMPFTVAQGVSLDGIAVGDVVEFKLRVDWEAEGEPTEITEVKELPPGTQLVFREAKPAQ
jgi:Cu/Ag efflux protein CusF